MRRRGNFEYRLTRRRFLGLAAANVTALIASGCGNQQKQASSPGLGTPSSPPRGALASIPATESLLPTATNVPTPPPPSVTPTPERGQLLARPSNNVASGDVQPGRQQLGITAERDALLYVPAGYTSDRPAPLVLLLHGAGGDAEGGLGLLQPLADASNLLLVATASRRQTWDVIGGEYGPDVSVIDQALTKVFTRYAVDSSRLAVGGFSDGASYALSLGLINGDLFTHILAFSPGYIARGSRHGKPHLFISHGTRDEVLPIDVCSRRIVPVVQRAGYDVQYREFDGPHTVPPEIAQEAITWFTTGNA
ncbi:MAG: phospholipase [Chloroflexi bacterium]|nr:MAG: phospholipase [Chloroflexota bacterium]